VAFRFAGAEVGGAVLALLAFRFLGERRPVRLAVMAVAVAGVIQLANWLGI
jgi:hypothetical protein